MPTAASWTETPVRTLRGFVAEWRRSVQDVGHLVRFRAAGGRRRRTYLAAAILGGLTLCAVLIPALLPSAGARHERALHVLLLVPSAYAALVLLALVSAVASGGGRELIGRDQGVAFPVSPTTDHLGALLLAPLNIAWLIQAWSILGAVAYGVGPARLLPATIGTLVWIALATACGQVVAWVVEGVRRLRGGEIVVRALFVACLLSAAAVQVTGNLGHVLDRLPTSALVARLVGGWSVSWALAVAGLMLALLVAVVVGAVPAGFAARRPPREELRAEGGLRRPRRLAATDLGQLIRTDRASVWRSVPMRRGVMVLGIGPGLVAVAGGLPWHQLPILPGLVASGGALLFGVNAWCLDVRGVLWRESLPVSPRTVFAARAWVLAEFLVAASSVTLLLGALRAGRPTAAELCSLACAWVVVVLQVVSAALRWSLRTPYSVDLRSARATPAPPVAMVAYSTKLAIGTTLTSLVFSGLARVPAWPVSILVACPFVAWSVVRLWSAREGWEDPVERARVVMTVAG